MESRARNLGGYRGDLSKKAPHRMGRLSGNGLKAGRHHLFVPHAPARRLTAMQFRHV
jgi:hypothetical protein